MATIHGAGEAPDSAGIGAGFPVCFPGLKREHAVSLFLFANNDLQRTEQVKLWEFPPPPVPVMPRPRLKQLANTRQAKRSSSILGKSRRLSIQCIQ